MTFEPTAFYDDPDVLTRSRSRREAPMTRVICCQLAPVLGDLNANLAAATEAIGDAAAAGADIIVLPELATSGYCFGCAEEARAAALTAGDPAFDRWAEAARGAVVVAGFAEAAGDRLYDSAMLLDGRGGRFVYRKAHLWDREKLIYTPGAAPAPVVRTPAGHVGLLVCYDLAFPEMYRSLALRGAQLVAAPVNWPRSDHPAGLPCSEALIAMASARVNRMVVVCCDRSGTERGQEWNEATTIIGSDGWVLATADGRGRATADVDLALTADKRLSARNDLLGDRRPELYA
jgi:5-aminopentanamidase